MRFKFLGTGTSQGIPLIGCDCATCASKDKRDKRLRPSIYISLPTGEGILVDTSPDLRAQALRAKIKRVDAILLTHEHRDHIGGLDDIRPFNFRQNGEIPVFALPRTAAALRGAFDYIFREPKYPGVPLVDLRELAADNLPFAPLAGRADFLVQPVPVLHGSLPIVGYRFGDLAYLTDTKYIPDSSMPLLQGLKILIISALHQQEHHSHNTLEEAIAWAQKIGAEQTYFMHMSHQLPPAALVDAWLPKGISLAYDGQSFRL